MKTFTPLIAACAILMACNAADPVSSTTTRTPPDRPPLPYVLSGIVHNENWLLLPGAKAEILGGIDVAAYTQHEVRVNSYYEPEEFNLRAEFVPSGP